MPGSTVTIHDPADGSLVGELPVATPDEVHSAVASAAAQAGEWARTSPASRAAAVRDGADRLADAAHELAVLTTREMGKPLDDARGGVEAGIGTLRQYAELGPLHRGRSLQGSWDATDLMVPQPRGVVAVITPWNDPAVLAGRTDLLQLAAEVASARLVVCGDTGVAHLATAYATPSVLLFGPTPPSRWGPPPGGPHEVLWHGVTAGDPWAERTDPALLAIDVAEVLGAADRVLRLSAGGSRARTTPASS